MDVRSSFLHKFLNDCPQLYRIIGQKWTLNFHRFSQLLSCYCNNKQRLDGNAYQFKNISWPSCLFFFSSVLFFSSLFYYYYFLLASPSLNRSLVCSVGRSFVCLLVNAFNKWACLTTYNIWKPMMMFVYSQYNFIARVAVSSVYRFSFSSFDSYMCGTINQIAGVFWTTSSSSSYLYSLRMVGWLVWVDRGVVV